LTVDGISIPFSDVQPLNAESLISRSP